MSPICELVLSIQQWPRSLVRHEILWSKVINSQDCNFSLLTSHFTVEGLSTHQVLIVGTLVSRYLPRQLHVRSLSVTSGPGLCLALGWQPSLHDEGTQGAEQLRQVQAVLVNTVGC